MLKRGLIRLSTLGRAKREHNEAVRLQQSKPVVVLVDKIPANGEDEPPAVVTHAEEEQIALEQRWQLEKEPETNGIDEVSASELNIQLIIDQFKTDYLTHVKTLLTLDESLYELLDKRLEHIIQGIEIDEETVREQEAELADDDADFDYLNDATNGAQKHLTEDNVLLSGVPSEMDRIVRLVLRKLSSGIVVGNHSVNRSKRGLVTHDKTSREKYSLIRHSSVPAEHHHAILCRMVYNEPPASVPLLLSCISGGIRNKAVVPSNLTDIVNRLKDTPFENTSQNPVNGARGLHEARLLLNVYQQIADVEKKALDHMRSKRFYLDQYMEKIPSFVKEQVADAIKKQSQPDERAQVSVIVKSIAKLCLQWETRNRKYTELYGRREAIAPRHFHAASTLLHLLVSVTVNNVRPFLMGTIRVRKTPLEPPISMTILRIDADFADLTKSESGFVTDYPPMICPPEPWLQLRMVNGRKTASPYKTLSASLLRFSNSNNNLCKRLMYATAQASHQTNYVKSLDYINNVRWRLSEVAIKHSMYVKATGLDMGDKLRGGWIPLPPVSPKFKTFKSQGVHKLAVTEQSIKIAQRTSASASAGQITDLTQKFRNKTLWLPSNCDFRGRTYPLHAGLNYQASDFIRSLLEFADAKPLGANGLFHLKIHAANLMGLDKASFDDRIQWCDSNVESIIRNQEDPESLDALWRSADKPLLGYTVLCELANALKHSSGPRNYETRVPIHVDGSCNGLQHYSALALDVKGATTANLTRKSFADKPSDVYTTVLEQVKVYNQAEMSTENSAMAVFVHPLLKRKTVKQSVMTNVYGVTNMGMTNQVHGQLVSQTENMVPRPSAPYLKTVARYVVTLIQKSLEDVFMGAIHVQKWFKAGVPVMQPYFQEKPEACKVKVMGAAIDIAYKQTNFSLSWTKNKTAFPPNFIHSMDASHVHATTCKMSEAGIDDFGSVHDSYWGHACDMDVLNNVLRKSFVEMYTPDRLEHLYMDLSSSYGRALRAANMTLPLPPKRGDFDISEVMESPYFFA